MMKHFRLMTILLAVFVTGIQIANCQFKDAENNFESVFKGVSRILKSQEVPCQTFIEGKAIRHVFGEDKLNIFQ